MISRLRQSLGTKATFTGGDTLGVMQPVKAKVNANNDSLVFIAFGMFDFAVVECTVALLPGSKRCVSTVKFYGTPLDAGHSNHKGNSFHSVCILLSNDFCVKPKKKASVEACGVFATTLFGSFFAKFAVGFHQTFVEFDIVKFGSFLHCLDGLIGHGCQNVIAGLGHFFGVV